MKQLELFEALPTESSIKPGDWVKLQRKSNNAAHMKKGDIVQVESVHPLDSSIRFWNERSEGWGYLYPDEIVPVPPPVDSVSRFPIPLDTESTPESVDTESKPESVEFDSVSRFPRSLDTESTPESVDTESKPESVEFDSVSRFPRSLDTESTPESVDTESKPEPVEIDSVSGPVSTYSPKGTARCGELKYFRFSYRCGSKMKHVHIPGGCTAIEMVRERAAEVMELAAAGVPAGDIALRIKSWRRQKSL